MYLARFLVFLVLVYYVECRNNVKALTESLGSEVIEIGTPIKELQELPPGVEEEPSAEEDAPSPAPRQDKRPLTTAAAATSVRSDREESGSHEDEEARIEKELADIYKDTDYKAENADTKKVLKSDLKEDNVTVDKMVARAPMNFKFQPDVNNRADIERFRTSVDEISCDRRVTQRLQADPKTVTSAASEYVMSFIEIGSVLLSLIVCY